MPKKKIILAHGYWGRGGAEIATMYLLEAIVSSYEVSIVTRGGWNIDELNEAAGTSLEHSDIHLIKLPFAFLLKQTKGGAIWHALFLRYCRCIASKYDIRITASRVIGWGKPAVHFLSDVVWNETLEQEYESESVRQSLFKRFMTRIGNSLAGSALNELDGEDIFIANSKWTAKQSEPYTTTEPIVIYPPVNQEFELVGWENRRDHFVSFGRISPEKEIEKAIAILEGVRNNGFDIKFAIIGQFGIDDYSKKIQRLIKEKDWVDALGAVYREKISTILPLYRYGINTCIREAFGISTAEMIKAGIITFIPRQGAQNEIVNNSNLTFSSLDDAVVKISAVLKSDELRCVIMADIKKSAPDFPTLKFKNNIVALLKNL